MRPRESWSAAMQCYVLMQIPLSTFAAEQNRAGPAAQPEADETAAEVAEEARPPKKNRGRPPRKPKTTGSSANSETAAATARSLAEAARTEAQHAEQACKKTGISLSIIRR